MVNYTGNLQESTWSIGITTSITLLGISEINIPIKIPPTEAAENTRMQIKCLQKVMYWFEASSMPKQKPTTSLWDAIAPNSNKT